MANRFECILYQSPLAVKALPEANVADDGNTLIVELSMISILAPVFDAQVKLRAGLAGILGDSSRVNEVTRNFPSLNNPIILASRPQVSDQSTIGALSRLKNIDLDQDQVAVMVHFSDLRRYSYALQLMDSFTFMLERNAPIPFALVDAARLLKHMHLLTDASWKGLVPFLLPDQQASNDRDELWDMLQSEFSEHFMN